MKAYNFKVILDPDEDFDGKPSGWHAYVPVLESQGASTWGETQTAALKNIDEVVRLVVESMIEHGQRIPDGPVGEVHVEVGPHGYHGHNSRRCYAALREHKWPGRRTLHQ